MRYLIKGFRKGMSYFGDNIVTIINSSLLMIVYFLGVGITSIIAKITKKKFLKTRFSKNSYWNTLKLSKKTTEEYYRQF